MKSAIKIPHLNTFPFFSCLLFPVDATKGVVTEKDTARTTERHVTEEGTLEEVTTTTTRKRMTHEPAQTPDKKKVVEAAEEGTEVVEKLVVEKPVEVWVIEDENGEKTEIEVEERDGKLFDVKTGEEVQMEGYDTGEFTCSNKNFQKEKK